MTPSGVRRVRRGIEATVIQPDGRERAASGLAAWLANAAPRSARGSVTLALVSDRRMRVLNRTFRGKDYATDVLSFVSDERQHIHGPSSNVRRSDVRGRRTKAPGAGRTQDLGPRTEDETGSLGELAIAVGVARRQAREQGHSLALELRILALHGLLHLLGYDHERDRGTMHRVEERLRRRAGLPTGLIARTRD